MTTKQGKNHPFLGDFCSVLCHFRPHPRAPKSRFLEKTPLKWMMVAKVAEIAEKCRKVAKLPLFALFRHPLGQERVFCP